MALTTQYIATPNMNLTLSWVSPVLDWLETILKDLMNTDSARKIAERREKFMTTYIEEFMLEWNCEEEIC